MSTPLFDSHCHLDADYGGKSVAELLREAALSGVTAFLAPATDLASAAKLAALSEQYPEILHAVGFHPHQAKDFREADLAALRAAAAHRSCRAIGEIGLDYHYDFSSPGVQTGAFVRQLELAAEIGLPVIVHCREAETDVLRHLRAHTTGLPAGASPGIIHCFTGSRSFGEDCLALGFLISFSGIVTFKNATGIQECAAMFPLDRLLIETDAPYLAPLPFRGRRCEPSMIAHTAARIASLRGISVEEVAAATTANARRVFRLA